MLVGNIADHAFRVDRVCVCCVDWKRSPNEQAAGRDGLIMKHFLMAVFVCLAGCSAPARKAPPTPPLPPGLTFQKATRTSTPLAFIPASGDTSDPILFRIISVSPVRKNIAGLFVQACVLTPSNAHYVIQVSTNMTLWHDRTGFSANNGQTSCWSVPLQTRETNRFFVRAKLQ